MSVIVPTFGRERILLETLAHLLELDPGPDEIVVVDQTPRHELGTEREIEHLRATERVRWIRLLEPSIPVAMNVGLTQARFDRVLFVDDDVVPDPDLVAAHRAAAEEDSWDIVAGRVLQPGEDPEEDGGGFSSTTSGEVEEFMAGNVSMGREFARSIGGFDENFVRAAYRFEAEFADRARRAGARIGYEPGAVIHHLRASSGGTRSWGHHLRTMRPGPSVGAYYYVFRCRPAAGRPLEVVRRLLGSVCTRHHLRRPWWIPLTLTGELLGLGWAVLLAVRGPRLMAIDVSRERVRR